MKTSCACAESAQHDSVARTSFVSAADRLTEPVAAVPQQPLRDAHVPRESRDLVRQFQICAEFGISDETWRRWVRRGEAPQPVDLPGRPRWRRTDIDRFKQGRRESVSGRRVFFGTAVRRRA